MSDRDDFLERLRAEGEKMARKLGRELDMPVEFDLRPSLTRGLPACTHPGCGLPERLHGAPPGEPPNPTRSTHRFQAATSPIKGDRGDR